MAKAKPAVATATKKPAPKAAPKAKKSKSSSAANPEGKYDRFIPVELIDITTLKPNPWNPNEMDEAQFASLVHGMEAEGFITPVLVQKKTMRIIDGEHRWRAATQVGYTQAPVQLKDCDDATAKKLTLAFNNRRGHHAPDKLDTLLSELAKHGDLDPLDVGMSAEDMNRVLDNSSSFLDDMAKGDDSDSLESGNVDLDSDGDLDPTPTRGDFAKLQYLATPEQKKVIVDAVIAAKKELDTPHSGVALAHICQQFLEGAAS